MMVIITNFIFIDTTFYSIYLLDDYDHIKIAVHNSWSGQPKNIYFRCYFLRAS